MSDDRPIVYQENNATIYRASSFGHCLRQHVLYSRGNDPMPWPKGILAAFEYGNQAEAKLVTYMRRPEMVVSGRIQDDPLTYWSIFGEQREFDLELLPGRIIRCHVDAIGRKFNTRSDDNPESIALGSMGDFVIEFKAFGDKLLQIWMDSGLSALDAYRHQVSIEMLCTGLPCLFVVLDKDKSTDSDLVVYYEVIETPPISKPQLIQRLLQFEKYLKTETLPECGEAINDGYCPYYKFHDPDLRAYSATEILSADNQLSSFLQRYDVLGEDIRLLERERETLKRNLREIMGVDKPVRFGNRVFGFYTGKPRTEYDVDGLLGTIEALAPELDRDQFKVARPGIVTGRFSDAPNPTENQV